MTCQQARQLLHAYLDDELDLPAAMELEAHLLSCSACQKELDAAQAATRAVAQSAVYYRAPAILRDRVNELIQSETSDVNLPRMEKRSTRWWTSPMAFSGVAAAILLILSSTLFFLPTHDSRGLADELVDSHLRSLEANHLLDVESTDQHTVKPWFSGKLDFSPPVVDLAYEGFPLVGGRLDYLDGKNIAALIYHHDKHLINLFIWPGEGNSGTTTKRGFNLIRFDCKGMACSAISDLNVAELQHFVDLFQVQKAASTRQ